MGTPRTPRTGGTPRTPRTGTGLPSRKGADTVLMMLAAKLEDRVRAAHSVLLRCFLLIYSLAVQIGESFYKQRKHLAQTFEDADLYETGCVSPDVMKALLNDMNIFPQPAMFANFCKRYCQTGPEGETLVKYGGIAHDMNKMVQRQRQSGGSSLHLRSDTADVMPINHD